MGKDKAEDVKGRSDKEEEGNRRQQETRRANHSQEKQKKEGAVCKNARFIKETCFPKGKKEAKSKSSIFFTKKMRERKTKSRS